MDLHPIVVHFPIALLTLYALFEIASIEKLNSKPYWFYVKALFVIPGSAGAVLAVLTGLFSSHNVSGVRLVDMHEIFGFLTLITFVSVALFYAGEWIMRTGKNSYSICLPGRPVLLTLSIIGLVLVTVTGGLGGAIVYGTEFDPFMSPVFKLLGV